MFIITFEDELHRQWSTDFVFTKFNEAKEYLLEKGFIEKNRLFVRENCGWVLYEKAYITPLKVYTK